MPSSEESKMYYFEVCEIGRESVKSVNASILANLIKTLVIRHEKNPNSKIHHRKFFIKCGESLEFSPKKYKKIGDDEGFESDGNEEDSLSGEMSNEDAQSTTSSCCMVEDHVFKSIRSDQVRGKDPASLISVIGSIDSANSSGSSDTDELEFHSLTPSPIAQSKKLLQKKKEFFFDKNQSKSKREEYPISDVIFCHTEPKCPNVIAWVIKKQPSDFGSRLGKTGVETFSKMENCLEVVVVKCKNSDGLRELCSNYQEYSRRTKLDNYKSIKRKKESEEKRSVSLSPLSYSKEARVSLSDLKAANSGLIKASELSILNPKIVTNFRSDLIKNSVSLNSLIRPEKTTNLEIKVPVSSALPAPAKLKTQSLMNVSNPWDSDSNKAAKRDVLKEKNSDSTDQFFNLVQRTDQNGVTHLEVTKNWENKSIATDRFSNKSKLRKEIEGVILTDVENHAKKEQVRQRNGMEDGDFGDRGYECPPIRPERRKKKSQPPLGGGQVQEARSNVGQIPVRSRDPAKSGFFLTPQDSENQFRRENQKSVQRSPFVNAQHWQKQNLRESAPRNWKQEARGRPLTKSGDKSADGGRRSKSAGTPFNKAPMAYRYVCLAGDGHDRHRDGSSARRAGIPSKIRQVGENLTNSMHNLRRRNSFDDVVSHNYNKNGSCTNLKSVIKKSKKVNDKYCEPKKVTFSAFATVQVVD